MSNVLNPLLTVLSPLSFFLKLQAEESDDYLCRIRYRQALTEANLVQKNNELIITFNKPQRGITAGQFVAWYKNDELIGSGVIN